MSFHQKGKVENPTGWLKVMVPPNMATIFFFLRFHSSKELIGKTGIAHTVLRPSGKVLIDDQVYDAFTRGDYVQKGDPIEVIGTEGITLKVKVVG